MRLGRCTKGPKTGNAIRAMAPRMVGICSTVPAPLALGTGIKPKPTLPRASVMAAKMAPRTMRRVVIDQGLIAFLPVVDTLELMSPPLVNDRSRLQPVAGQ